jgi:hypothetical protein
MLRQHPSSLVCAIAIGLCACASLAAECGPLDDPLQLIEIRLEMDPADWEQIRRDNTFELERPATFRACDEGPLPVAVRRKKGRAYPSEDDPAKPSLKIDFDDAALDAEWRGHRKLSFENGNLGRGPNALLREGLAWHLVRQAGVVTGGFSWVRLLVNGEPIGVYTRIEQIDKSFLRRRLDEDEGFLYKFDYRAQPPIVRLTRVDEPDPYASDLCFPPFGDTCGRPPDAAARSKEHADLRQLLTIAAVNAAIGNPDGLLHAANNYFFYNSGRPRLYLTWDNDIVFLDNTVEAEPHAMGGPESYPGFILGQPQLLAEFDGILRRLIRDPLSAAAVAAFLDGLEAEIGPAMDADPTVSFEGGFAGEAARLESWVARRGAFLESRIGAGEPSPLVISEVLASNATSGTDEAGESADWVELHNRGAAPIALGSSHLSDDPAEPLKWPFPAVDLPPGGFLVVWCDKDVDEGPLHAEFQLDAGGEAVGIYTIVDGIVRTVDFVAFGPQESDVSLGRGPDGAPGFRRFPCPTPGAANDAACPDGARFVRGDASEDGELSLTDAVRILGGLFLGQPLDCEAAGDADGDGRVALTDAVRVLSHLFQGGPRPPAPYPECGRGSELPCAEHMACRA